MTAEPNQKSTIGTTIFGVIFIVLGAYLIFDGHGIASSLRDSGGGSGRRGRMFADILIWADDTMGVWVLGIVVLLIGAAMAYRGIKSFL